MFFRQLWSYLHNCSQLFISFLSQKHIYQCSQLVSYMHACLGILYTIMVVITNYNVYVHITFYVGSYACRYTVSYIYNLCQYMQLQLTVRIFSSQNLYVSNSKRTYNQTCGFDSGVDPGFDSGGTSILLQASGIVTLLLVILCSLIA